ncbi:hypothetical protein STEG23_028082 [Scotinomys teguina]
MAMEAKRPHNTFSVGPSTKDFLLYSPVNHKYMERFLFNLAVFIALRLHQESVQWHSRQGKPRHRQWLVLLRAKEESQLCKPKVTLLMR